ncbi:E-selectin-like [Ciona intestinalis]
MRFLEYVMFASFVSISAAYLPGAPLRCPPFVSPAEFVTFRHQCSSNSNAVFSFCIVYCQPGYTHYGIRFSRCGYGGQWSPSRNNVPTGCRITGIFTHCPQFSNPVPYSYLCTNNNLIGSVCNIYCPSGQQINNGGISQTTCEANGHWILSPSATYCVPSVQCPALPSNVVYSASCNDGNNQGSVCNFQCPPNQDMFGTSSSTCGSNGEWYPAINTQCSVRCLPGVPVFHCFAPPCGSARCPALPNAVCQDNYCGGCSFKFFVNGTEKSRQECIVQDPSCPLLTTLRCPDTCGIATCNGHPHAVCKMCGCHPRFYDYNTLRQVTCIGKCFTLAFQQY